MKELSIEEKAKAYDEAIEKLRNFYRDYDTVSRLIDVKEELANLFPELKESKDERIRKNIIATIHLYYGEPLDDEAKEMIAWLEKQGEHKRFIDHIQIGDKVTRNKNGVLVNLSQLDRVAKKDNKQGEQIDLANKEYWRGYREGKQEILDKYSELEKQGEQKQDVNMQINPSEYINDMGGNGRYLKNTSQMPTDKVEPKFKVGDWIIYRTGDTVIQIVNNKSFYESVEIWGQERTDTYNYIEQGFRLWTLADAKDGDVLADGNLPFIFKKIDTNKYSYAYCGISVDDGFKIGKFDVWTWMQDIKPATKEQRDLFFQKMKEAGYEWNADKKELKKIDQKPEEKPLISLKDFQDAFELKAKQYDIELPNRGYDIHAMCKELYSLLIKQNSAWSKEDERMLDIILNDISYAQKNFSDSKLIPYDRKVAWLRTFKDRYAWKPSDEQIEALIWQVNNTYKGSWQYKATKELLEQLKKIKG